MHFADDFSWITELSSNYITYEQAHWQSAGQKRRGGGLARAVSRNMFNSYKRTISFVMILRICRFPHRIDRFIKYLWPSQSTKLHDFSLPFRCMHPYLSMRVYACMNILFEQEKSILNSVSLLNVESTFASSKELCLAFYTQLTLS